MKQGYRYFQNTECEYFPCHKPSDGHFNCLFCYCPLYALGDACGGDFVYTKEGIKDCSNCTKPHGEKGYAYVMSKIDKISNQNKK